MVPQEEAALSMIMRLLHVSHIVSSGWRNTLWRGRSGKGGLLAINVAIVDLAKKSAANTVTYAVGAAFTCSATYNMWTKPVDSPHVALRPMPDGYGRMHK